MAEFGLPGLLQSAVGLRGRMAGACGGSSRAAGPRRDARLPGNGEARDIRAAYRGRLLLALAGIFLLGSAHAQILSSRIWPAREYTRLTLESKEDLKYTI